jgi:hypothetical protein
VSPVTAAVHVVPARRVLPIVGVEATLQVSIEPRSAAAGDWWFQATAWQGGGLVIADMRPSGPGQWTSKRAVPIGGGWKTLIRFHKGSTMMAVPVYFPVDPAVTPEIPALDRTTSFANERHYLLREERPGAGWYADLAETLILLIVGSWLASLALAATRIASARERPEDRHRSPSTEAPPTEMSPAVVPR